MCKLVTLDTNVIDDPDIRSAGCKRSHEVASISVTERETRDSPFSVHLHGTKHVKEVGAWDESEWGNCVWGGSDNYLEELLQILSDGSFPKNRASLTGGQRRQLRDAMILEVHLRNGRDILVTNDARAFIGHGRRQAIEAQFKTKIMTANEYIAYCNRS